jgi:hypothetical protein
VNAIIAERFDEFPFESCLSYVRLPPRKHQRSEVQGAVVDMDSLDTYRAIFKFLQKKGVKKIF